MKYQVERYELGKWILLMQCDFEDKEQFELIAQGAQNRILCDGVDVTEMYVEGRLNKRKV